MFKVNQIIEVIAHPDTDNTLPISQTRYDVLADVEDFKGMNGPMQLGIHPERDDETTLILRESLQKWVDNGGVLPEWTIPELPTPTLTARQFRLGLLSANITLQQVSDAINAITNETDRQVAQIEWEYATTFERLHPLVSTLGSSFGLTEEQIDELWNTSLLF